MPDRMSNRMSEDMSDRMPEDLPVRKCINVMVGITRSKVIIYNYTVRSTIISWSISHTTSALKDHTPLEAVPELTEKDVNLLGDVEGGVKDEMADVYGKQLASVKAAKIQSAQALLDKANGNGKVIKNLKEGRGKGKGRGRGKRAKGTSKVIPNQNLVFAQFSELDSFFFLSPAPPTNCCWCPGGLWTRSM